MLGVISILNFLERVLKTYQESHEKILFLEEVEKHKKVREKHKSISIGVGPFSPTNM